MGASGTAPPARLTGASTNRCPGCCPETNQSTRGAGRLSLPGRSSPQWARPPLWHAVPAAAHPRLEPCSASFSQSLQCSWSFSSAAGRGDLAGGRLTAVSLSSAILNGASARAAPPQQSAPRLGGEPRGMPGVVVYVGMRGPGCARAETTIPVSLWGCPGAGRRWREGSLTPGSRMDALPGGEPRPFPLLPRSTPKPRCSRLRPLPV